MRQQTITVWWVLLVMGTPAAYAYDVNDKLSINGVLAGAVQCWRLSEDAGAGDNECRGGLPFQLELSFRPADTDEFFTKFGFGVGNGLNKISPFTLATWAADLEDDVKDINGRNRDYLLTAWYKHTFRFGDGHTLGTTLGIIDATDYLDDNAYSNNEYTQFMNEALVNGPNGFLPSYDTGGVLEWDWGRWSLRGVLMNVGKNDDNNEYNFFGVQVGYTAQTALGEGHYRILVDMTSSDFLNPEGTQDETLTGLILSFDQQLGDGLGSFLRFGWQDDAAAVDYDALYSGGIDLSGRAWGRANDNIGLGYAYLDGGNLDLHHIHVTEFYYCFVVNDFLALTADIQYMKDEHKEEKSPKGWILGLRATAEF
jgi:hypothetical protein